MTQNGLDLIEVLLSNEDVSFLKGKRKKKFYFDKQELTLLLELKGIAETRHCKTQDNLIDYLQDMWLGHKTTEEHYLDMLQFINRYKKIVEIFLLKEGV